MTNPEHSSSRRNFLKAGTSAFMLPWLPGSVFGSTEQVDYDLTAMVSKIQLANAPFPETEVWGFNQNSPGPLLRLRHGERNLIRIKNALPQPLTVHWHGL